MLSLILGIIMWTALGVATFFVGRRLTRDRSRAFGYLLSSIALAWIGVYLFFIRDSVWQTRVLPIADLIVWGNWLMPGVGLLAGVVYQRSRWRVRYKLTLIIGLFVVAFHSSFEFILLPEPWAGNIWKDDVCRQTTWSTCGAASAATLLRAYDIDATESEMVTLCLTRVRGTTVHGQYRGLKLKTADTPWDVEVFETDLQGLRDRLKSGPAIINVVLKEAPIPSSSLLSPISPLFQGHAVVVFSMDDHLGTLDVGDSSLGRERWKIDTLHEIWKGIGLQIVK